MILAACGNEDERSAQGLELTGGGDEQVFYADETEETGGFKFYAPAAWQATVDYSVDNRASGDGWLRLLLGGVSVAHGPAGNNLLVKCFF